MHFSRNPPGPNTSCIEGFADSLPGTVGSSSMGTYSRRAGLAARPTFVPGASPAELDTRLARKPPLLSPVQIKRAVTIAYPSRVLAASSRSHETPWRISSFETFSTRTPCRFLQCLPLASAVKFNREFLRLLPGRRREGNRRPTYRGVLDGSQQGFVFRSGPLFFRSFILQPS